MTGIKVIPTNGQIDMRGFAVMGAGLALDAKNKYPELPARLGRKLKTQGNNVYFFTFHNREFEPLDVIFTFPTKGHWKDKSDMVLIEKSAVQLKGYMDELWDIWGDPTPFLAPKVGCGLGNLNWKDVKPLLENIWKTEIERGQVIFVE
jgi:hypothetical protein